MPKHPWNAPSIAAISVSAKGGFLHGGPRITLTEIKIPISTLESLPNSLPLEKLRADGQLDYSVSRYWIPVSGDIKKLATALVISTKYKFNNEDTIQIIDLGAKFLEESKIIDIETIKYIDNLKLEGCEEMLVQIAKLLTWKAESKYTPRATLLDLDILVW